MEFISSTDHDFSPKSEKNTFPNFLLYQDANLRQNCGWNCLRKVEKLKTK
jgi:hypothetical protein